MAVADDKTTLLILTILSGKSAFETTLISPGQLVIEVYIIYRVDLEICQLDLHIINYFVKTKIEKNVPFLCEHIRYCSIYTFTGHICDAGKVEII